MKGINAPYKKLIKRNKPSQNDVTKKENPIEEAPRASSVSTINVEENPRLHKSKKEELLNKQTYILPDLTRTSGEETLRSKTDQKEEHNNDKGNEEKFESSLESSMVSVYADSSDVDLTSDLSEDLLDDRKNTIKSKPKKPASSLDAEEKFRTHFLKSFQGMPRLSQISLDEPSSKTKVSNENLQNIQELTDIKETLKTSLSQSEDKDIKLPSKVNIIDHLTEEQHSSEDN